MKRSRATALLAVSALTFVLGGCASTQGSVTKTKYTGNSYPSTVNPVVYWGRFSTTRATLHIGDCVFEGFTDPDDLRKSARAEAAEHGAHVVILGDLNTNSVDSTPLESPFDPTNRVIAPGSRFIASYLRYAD